jgi:protein-S-isoprenylcysteine O-methyltransferase Ste14
MEIRLAKIADYAERLFLVLISATFLHALLPNVREHPLVLLFVISECLPVLLILIRRPGKVILEPYPFILALVGTSAPLLVRPVSGGTQLIPEAVAMSLMLVGVCVNIAAKMALWRSFGLVAANRGVRSGGPYRWVRHPMYLGYILTQLGFLLTNLSLGNLVKYLLTWTVQLLRIREEEKFLMRDEKYRALADRVRFRLVPGLY